MKECPFIDECEDDVTETSFKAFCQMGGFHCPTYRRMLRIKQGEPLYQKPREWKKEKEG
ncbi:hypothetical protein GH146_00570 [archaeon]|nr:hypothetical protein [archaeon]